MKIKCIYNQCLHLPKDLFFEDSTLQEDSFLPLVIDKEYLVYAITINDGYVWY
jgi:hypothetical protein